MAFTGFPEGGLDFFAQLAAKQDREWFKEHKAEYQRLWETPMKELFDALAASLRKSFKKVGEPKHFRIYRDVRFSKDKSPFNTSISAVVPLYGGDAMMGCGLYAELGSKPFVAAGRWMLEGAQLTRYRAALGDEKKSKTFTAGFAKAKKAGYSLMTRDALKRVPPGFDPEHPNAELLKHKGFALAYPALKTSQLGEKKLVEWIVAKTSAIAPLLAWVETTAK